MTVPFWVLYVIAGTTDMLDGFVAKRWGVESKFGAKLDSLADFVFVLAVGYKLFPWLANNTIRHRIVPFVTCWS